MLILCEIFFFFFAFAFQIEIKLYLIKNFIQEEAEHLMHRELSSEQYPDTNDNIKNKTGTTFV